MMKSGRSQEGYLNNMDNTIVVGTALGDEGKAKVVDYLSSNARVCVRFNGGCNAGHSVYHEDKKYVFHL